MSNPQNELNLIQPRKTKKTEHFLLWVLEHWLLLFALLFGLFNLLPFLAPVFMRLGWDEAGRLIYSLYGPLCHQMAQRSFFLFGRQSMYRLDELPIVLTGNSLTDTLALRAFLGNAELGWKVAWSDRMVYMYGAVLLAGIFYAWQKRRKVIRPFSLPVFALFLLPMFLDGASHFLSDISAGMATGFRYENLWLVNLTGRALPLWFYRGDSLGSFNAWMRLLTGLAFGFGTVYFTFPYINQAMLETAQELRDKLNQRQI
jgi:uncharacterized membrane protein